MTPSIRSRPGTAVTGPDGTVYDSLASAARALGCHRETIRQHWMRYGHLEYLCKWAVPCEHRGQSYPSLQALADALGIKPQSLSYHLSRYGHLDRAGTGRGGKPGTKGKSRPLKIGPVEWPSRKAAAHDLGISLPALRRWTSRNATPQQRDRLLAAVMQAQRKGRRSA